ncbi:MAG: hypothetical protein KBC64_02205 [Simkaniaceae bacterium]|nr:hypothetical protein [Simkaniaceae bacterium]
MVAPVGNAFGRIGEVVDETLKYSPETLAIVRAALERQAAKPVALVDGAVAGSALSPQRVTPPAGLGEVSPFSFGSDLSRAPGGKSAFASGRKKLEF